MKAQTKLFIPVHVDNSLDNIILSSAYFTVSEGVQCFFIAEKTIFSQGSRGVEHFQRGGGSNFFQWGCPNANFYRNQ